MTKEQIIGGIRGFWFFRISPQYESVCEKFIEYVLKKENVEYTSADLGSFLNQNFVEDQLLLSYIYQYADLLSREEPSKENIEAMNRVKFECMRMKEIHETFSNLFDNMCVRKQEKPEEEIIIRKGESITLTNGAGSSLTTDELGQLVKMTFEDVEKPKVK